jgi:hypothetical protein
MEKAQDLINEIEREQTAEEEQNERGKQRANEFKQMFYKTLWNHEQADLNLSLVVGK